MTSLPPRAGGERRHCRAGSGGNRVLAPAFVGVGGGGASIPLRGPELSAVAEATLLSDDPDDYDAYADWVPPAKVYMDEIPVLDPELGKVPFWKSLLYNTARARTEMLRNDSAAVVANSLGEPDKPPRLAADEEPAIPSEVLSAIEEKINQLTARLDAYERTKRAEQALLDLEDRIEAQLPQGDDDDDMIKVH